MHNMFFGSFGVQCISCYADKSGQRQPGRLILPIVQKMLQSIALLAGLWGVAHAIVLNNPYPEEESLQKIYYASFNEPPKTLDPARSYAANEYQFVAQIYEPLLQYDYLKRPYQLVPLTASMMPLVQYFDKAGRLLSSSEGQEVARSVYTIHLKPGILYQPHPAFARDAKGRALYHPLSADFLDENGIRVLSDFPFTGTRELISDDYIYQIKRLANPSVNSPIYGLMSEYILGFEAFGKALPKTQEFIDLRNYPMDGVQKIDNYTFSIAIKGEYRPFLFWLAMPFFSPMPWEVDRFYTEPDMDDRNLNLGWYPVGTGPFMMVENNPNSRMVLAKNPNYRVAYFPSTATNLDKQYMQHAGERLPLIDKAVYTLEKESIPRWNKFLQGYYDLSGIGSDSFDKAIQIGPDGEASLTSDMQKKGIALLQTAELSTFYLGFNMLDKVVGGSSNRARLLRQAVSIAINYDENIAIFYNGRGHVAQGPIPPGVFGYRDGEAGINPFVYTWDEITPKRRSIQDARALMQAAGYPHGQDPHTKRALILHYDVPATGGPDDKEQLNWMRKQFARLGIALNVRATQYNRFQEKVRNGNVQIFSWGWNADYPDPENFLFLLYGPNGKVAHGGENAANYNNKEFNRLFALMKNRTNDATREQLIDDMVNIVRRDAPWAFGIHTVSLILRQPWVAPIKINSVAQNTLQFISINVPKRNERRMEWNQALLWPIAFFSLLMVLLLLPFLRAYQKKQQRCAERLP